MTKHQEIDLKQLGSILSRRRRLILVAAGACLALAVIVNLVTRPIYRATVCVEVRKEPNRSPLTGEAIASDQWQSDNIAGFTAPELVTHRTLLGEVAQKLDRRGPLGGKPRRPKKPPPWAGAPPPAPGPGPPRDELHRGVHPLT